ncbi:unnamed protein product [Caenorhabditis angaria]|uniref:Uncharacterized protein n=1 Tax=Caenorhabditis angaria TaxID=860376 RepID=A0A9P1IIC7_9PELO|nr:unnamed protein product [Caenorhabditis angaria]
MIFPLLLSFLLTHQGIQAYKDSVELTKDVRRLIIGATIEIKGQGYKSKLLDLYDKVNGSLVHASAFNTKHSMNATQLGFYFFVERKFDDVIDIDDNLMFTNHLLNETMYVHSVFTLKLRCIMNYTINYKYIVKSHYLPTNKEYEIVRMFIERPDDVINSTWKTPEGDEDLNPIPKAQNFSEEFCENLNFSDFLGEEEELADGSKFVGLLETNPGYNYTLGEFKDFLKIFFHKYQKTGKSSLKILTNDKSHVVFRCEVPLIYRTEKDSEFWTIDLEAIYHNSQWNFAKIFFNHNFMSNFPIYDRDAKNTAQLLRAEIISQLSGKVRRSGFDHESIDEVGFEIEVFENNSTYINVCPFLLAHPHPKNQYLKIKLPKTEGKMHFYTEITSHALIVNLYFPDDLGMKIRMKFGIGSANDLEQNDFVKWVTIICPETSGPPEGDFEIIERKEDEDDNENEEEEEYLQVQSYEVEDDKNMDEDPLT